MGQNTKVEYVDDSFSPWHGCSRKSAGCRFCFAADLERRWGNDNLWRRHGPRRIVSESTWRDPVKWNLAAQAEGRRRRILNGTMCDVFEDHPAVAGARARLFSLIEATPWLLWFPFTKRPELVPGMAPWGVDWPENVGLTTSVENQETADERIPLLQATSARLLCLSVEPLIGPVNFSRHDLSRIGWAIIGGESGAHARPMHPQWARDAHRQLTEAGVPVWFKLLCTFPGACKPFRQVSMVTFHDRFGFLAMSSVGHPEHECQPRGDGQDQRAELPSPVPASQGVPARLSQFGDHPVCPVHRSSSSAAPWRLARMRNLAVADDELVPVRRVDGHGHADRNAVRVCASVAGPNRGDQFERSPKTLTGIRAGVNVGRVCSRDGAS